MRGPTWTARWRLTAQLLHFSGERADRLVRFIGVTGRARPELLAHALRRSKFRDSCRSLGMADHLVSSPDRFCCLFAQERSTAVIAMKVLGHGEYLRYRPGHCALPSASPACHGHVGMNSIEQINQNVGDRTLLRAFVQDETPGG